MHDTNEKKRRKIRAENPSGACGYVGHLTADELKERAVGQDVDGSCPICGMVHLTRDEIEELERQKISESERFDTIKREAEAEGE